MDIHSFVSTDTSSNYYVDTTEAKKMKTRLYPKTKIPAGQTLIVSFSSISFPRLEMGDNSKLVLDSRLSESDITIWDGLFGKNCEIIADGMKGTSAGDNPADPWLTGWWQAPETGNGATGVRGIDGTGGSPAKKLIVYIGLTSIETLSIHANGGNGGNGGKGGNGQLGGNSGKILSHCGYGGRGGDGGNGGRGGNAANVDVKVWSNGSISLPNTMQYIGVLALRGNSGIGGRNGDGVRGGDDCPTGPPGNPGNVTLGGEDAKTTLVPIAKPTSLKQLKTRPVILVQKKHPPVKNPPMKKNK